MQNIRRDPFEQAVGEEQKSVMSIGGALAAPSTAYLYNWNICCPSDSIKHLLEKPRSLSRDAKYTVLNGLAYLAVGTLLVVWPGVTQTVFRDSAFAGHEEALMRVIGLTVAVMPATSKGRRSAKGQKRKRAIGSG